MINTLYVGQQYTNNMDINTGILDTTINDMGTFLSFSGFDLTFNRITIDNPIPGTGSIVAKIDFLFYHRISLTGDILTSIVYMDSPRKIDNVTFNRYNPKLIYQNTPLERTISIPIGATNFTLFNTLNASQLLTPFSDVAVFNSQKTALPVNGLPAAVISNDSIAKDGWYSVISMGICDELVSSGFIKKGFLCQDTTSTNAGDNPELGTVYVALVDNASPTVLTDITKWHPINLWSTTVSVGDIFNYVYEYNPWVRRDLFWMAQYNKIYRDTVIDFVQSDNNFGTPYINAKALHTSIDFYAGNARFAEAQFILQGTDYYRTTHNFLA